MSKQCLVVGLGISGMAAARLLLDQGHTVTAIDDKPIALDRKDLRELTARGMKVAAGNLPWDTLELVVVSPGVSTQHPIYTTALSHGIELIGEAELACRVATQPMVGITGTNGKTTVTLLAAHLLNNAGLPAVALGNVGDPLCSLMQPQHQDKIIVAELSSFQLDTMQSRVLDAAVVLNVTPDHLDRYPSMEAYHRSKLHIADCVKPGGGMLYLDESLLDCAGQLPSDIVVKFYGFAGQCALRSDGDRIVLDNAVETNWSVGYRGCQNHDVSNALAAYGLCKAVGMQSGSFARGLEGFKKPAHRIEFIREVAGVRFYDDSKGTNIDAVLKALATMTRPTILIAGGVHKGASYVPWAKEFKHRIKGIYAIGQAAPKIYEELHEKMPVTLCSSMEEAVKLSASAAVNGDAVMLSPGCSSYDMFKDYAHRGEVFNRLVHQL